MNNTLGFIILRCVKRDEHNYLWTNCYNNIRFFYPLNHIMIIDDGSNPSYVWNAHLENTTVINSEFIGRGEILPYYYYLKNKLFDRAVILHDGVFINKHIDFNIDNVFLWDFNGKWEHTCDYSNIIGHLHNNSEIINILNNPSKVRGCYGGMSVIHYDFLCILEDTFKFSNLLQAIHTRENRYCLERLIGIMFYICNTNLNRNQYTMFGNIHNYCPFARSYAWYTQNKEEANKLPIVKLGQER